MGYALFFGVLAGAMIAFPGEAAGAALHAMELWASSVAPVLGPFMACMLLTVPRLPGGQWTRTALAWLMGSPGGARLMQTVKPTGRGALRLAAMTGTMSPMFFLGTLASWLGSPEAARLILICHWLGALGVGCCIRGEKAAVCAPPAPLSLAQAMGDTARALLMIGVCMMLGSAAARLIACALPFLPPGASAAAQCLAEVTSGVKSLIGLRTSWTAPLTCAACSFGGLSLLMQNAAFWQEGGVTAGQLFVLRALHGLLSGTLCLAAQTLLHLRL